METRDRGMFGVPPLNVPFVDDSEKGGDGGVAISDATDEADFVNGVAMGEEAVVVGEWPAGSM